MGATLQLLMEQLRELKGDIRAVNACEDKIDRNISTISTELKTVCTELTDVISAVSSG
jgi:prefoldin subunit 5